MFQDLLRTHDVSEVALKRIAGLGVAKPVEVLATSREWSRQCNTTKRNILHFIAMHGNSDQFVALGQASTISQWNTLCKAVDTEGRTAGTIAKTIVGLYDNGDIADIEEIYYWSEVWWGEEEVEDEQRWIKGVREICGFIHIQWWTRGFWGALGQQI